MTHRFIIAALASKGFSQTEQRPAVGGVDLKVAEVDLFGIFVSTFGDEQRPVGVASGHHPGRRFGVDDLLLGGARLLQELQSERGVSRLEFDLPEQHEPGERHDLRGRLVAEKPFETVE
jgi:hypothetical protein